MVITNKELLKKIIDILIEADNRRINLLRVDNNGNTECYATRAMDHKETLEFIIKELKSLEEKIKDTGVVLN